MRGGTRWRYLCDRDDVEPKLRPLAENVREGWDRVVVDLVEEEVDWLVGSPAPLDRGPELGDVDRAEEVGAVGTERRLGEVQQEEGMPQQLVERDRVAPLTQRDAEERVGSDLSDLVERGHREVVVEPREVVLEEVPKRSIGCGLDEPLERRLGGQDLVCVDEVRAWGPSEPLHEGP